MKDYIIGSSHIAALEHGRKLLEVDKKFNLDVTLVPLFAGGHEMQTFSYITNKSVHFVNEEARVSLLKTVSMDYIEVDNTRWGICQGTHAARIYRSDMWRHFEPAKLCAADKTPISEAILEQIVLDDQKYIRLFLEQLLEVSANIYVISCPPPRADHFSIEMGTRPEVILHIHKFASDKFVEFLNKLSIPFISMPKNVSRVDGFLKEKYYWEKPLSDGRRDPHHANGAYGELMMQKIHDCLRNN